MKQNSNTALTEAATERELIEDFLGSERNVVAASVAGFLLGFGEELWMKFLSQASSAQSSNGGLLGHRFSTEGDLHR